MSARISACRAASSTRAHCSVQYRALARRSKSRSLYCRAEPDPDAASKTEATTTTTAAQPSGVAADKSVKNIAQTFAPRASGNTGKNPATKGSVLYDIFTYQAWILMAVGGLLSFNLIFPSDKPDIARLMGMWSVWMFTIPSLRARECSPQEKEWLNYAFLVVPLVNVTLPLLWKSFAAVYSADCITLAALFYWKVMNPEADSPSEAQAEEGQQ